jgi:hypothetical protein
MRLAGKVIEDHSSNNRSAWTGLNEHSKMTMHEWVNFVPKCNNKKKNKKKKLGR